MYGPSRLIQVASDDHCFLGIAVADAVVMAVDTGLLKQHIVIGRTCEVVNVLMIVVAVAVVVDNGVALLPNFLLDRYRVWEVQWVVDARTLR